ncbi:LacI family transcriptional regulator [Mobilisporobacter senegalensis]|uniref:LacI family transcriptional regulator n=1 Tax=Mobilisporobacter senegalensis TaxID=1329262 RepID=A0A3N1XRT5_9FIRM|nr:LacI family DNA-binding transcriptional regulator [Mobilisporobacter senegalensis]ROR29346.1 LacI family transcriptional regulator [Mobilisporobacter senegalensis]
MESITIKDIAKKCGVGVSTVSRAINNHPDINEETKTKIMQVIKEYNYIPNNSARNLKRTESNTIAVLIKGITNPFFNNILKVFESEIQDRKYSFLLHRVEEHEDEIDLAVLLAKEKRLKGIVFLGGYFYHSIEKLKQLKVPFVLSTGGVSEKIDQKYYSSVMVDDYKESYKMTDYLCKLGHKKIAIISAPVDDESIGKLRLRGFKQALIDNNITPNPNLVRYQVDDTLETFSMKYGYEVTKELLQTGEEFTAIYAISDSMAVGACKAIFESGKKVPDDYSVAGFDGLDISFYYHPSITTIRQPAEEMSQETIRILFDIIDNKVNKEHKTFDAELVIGQSTKEYKRK